MGGELRLSPRARRSVPGLRDHHAVPAGVDPLDALVQREDVQRVRAEVQQLEPWERELVFAVYYDDDDCAAFAKRWGVKASMVRQRLARIRKRLRAALSVLRLNPAHSA